MKVRRMVGSVAALAVATASLLFASTDAQAAATVPAQLSLSGVATTSAPLGGKVVGLRPGDTLQLSASTAPTAGLDKLGLGGLVGGVLNSVANYEVVAHFPAHFPGGKRDVTLGYKASTSINFPAKGTYTFTWDAYDVTLLGAAPIKPDGNALRQAGIAMNAQAQWVGQVVVADNPPAGGIAVQLPGAGISPSLPVLGNLPPVRLPGATTPSLPSLPGVGGSTGGSGGSHSQPSGPTLNYQPAGPSVADRTVPKGYGSGSGAPGLYVPPGLVTSGTAADAGSAIGANAVAQRGAGRPAPAAPASSTMDLASSTDPSVLTGLPAMLVVLAVIALSAATAFYARTFLVHGSRAAGVIARHWPPTS